MPLYTISLKDSITAAQRDALAAAITTIHTTQFDAPSLFVNVKFEDVSATPYYVGGKPKPTNAIHANVRPGPSRPRSAYDALCERIRAAWTDTLPPTVPLDTIFVLGSIVAGNEQGFALPEAGQDGAWIMENAAEFERRAKAGDETMRDLVEEIGRRGLGR